MCGVGTNSKYAHDLNADPRLTSQILDWYKELVKNAQINYINPECVDPPDTIEAGKYLSTTLKLITSSIYSECRASQDRYADSSGWSVTLPTTNSSSIPTNASIPTYIQEQHTQAMNYQFEHYWIDFFPSQQSQRAKPQIGSISTYH